MAEELETERPDIREDGQRPPRAVVGSHRVEEEMFGKAFDTNIVKRIWAFVDPYRTKIAWSVVAVLTFTAMQLLIPLIIRYAIDHGMRPGGDSAALTYAIAAFAVAISINYAASYAQETLVGGVAEHVLFDIRKAMFSHLQRVSLSFMDKTEVGRLMSRLQGDVNSMQEFLETSVLSVGDITLLFSIVFVMLYLDFKLGLMTLSVLPVLFIVRLFWLPLARKSFMAAHETNSVAAGALAEAIHGVRAVQSMDRQDVNFTLYDDKAHANLLAHLKAARYAQVMVPIVDALTGVAMALLVVVGGARVLGQALEVARPPALAVLRQLVQHVPGIQAGIVAIVEAQAHGVAADRLHRADVDLALATDQQRLAAAMSAHFGGRGVDAQVFARQVVAAAVGIAHLQLARASVQDQPGGDGNAHAPSITGPGGVAPPGPADLRGYSGSDPRRPPVASTCRRRRRRRW